MQLGVKRIIALALAGAYIIFTGYALYSGKDVPQEFITLVGMIIAYYFGKGNADETN